MAIIVMLVLPAACIYIPTPEHSHLSGRAIIPEEEIQRLEKGLSVINREAVLLKYGEPSRRYNNDEYFCYGWNLTQGYIIIGGGPYGGGVGGGPIGKTHWLCMQFDRSGILVHLQDIEPLLFESADKKRDKTLQKWNKSGASGELKRTYDYVDLDRIKRDIIYSLAEEGLPEAQWRLYEDSGRKAEDIAWLCRAADRGFKKAQLEVGRVYWAASEIPQHKVKAFVWYRLATSSDRPHGDAMDRKTLLMAEAAIREAVNALDNDQLIEAYQLYSEWEQGSCEPELANSTRQ